MMGVARGRRRERRAEGDEARRKEEVVIGRKRRGRNVNLLGLSVFNKNNKIPE